MKRLQQIAATRREGRDQPALERSAARLRLMPYRERKLASGRTVLLNLVIGQPLAVAPQAHHVDQHQRSVDRDSVGSCWRKFGMPVMA
jgi:type II secretory pathway component PulM